MIQAYLVLEDCTVFPGEAFGHPPINPEELALRETFGATPANPEEPGERVGGPWGVGEVVFNTAMTGYHEILTDPSYTGQIVVMTYPHIGNYGTSGNWSETGPESGAHRRKIKPEGLVVRSLYRGPLPKGRGNLDEFLLEHGIPGMTGVDTRGLTLHLRKRGSLTGIIVGNPGKPLHTDDIYNARNFPAGMLDRIIGFLRGFPHMAGRNLVDKVGTRERVELNHSGSPHVALLDCGIKAGIINQLLSRGCRITLFPGTTEAENILAAKPDGFVISNGPGDPAVLDTQIKTVRKMLRHTPTLGICLGHQLIALAAGAKTYKLKFGHHGTNHPVRDEQTRHVFVTSQNHGFAVDEASLPEGLGVWFRNANDQTIEGLRGEKIKALSVQFHPEAAPGPDDTGWIFDRFLASIEKRTSMNI